MPPRDRPIEPHRDAPQGDGERKQQADGLTDQRRREEAEHAGPKADHERHRHADRDERRGHRQDHERLRPLLELQLEEQRLGDIPDRGRRDRDHEQARRIRSAVRTQEEDAHEPRCGCDPGHDQDRAADREDDHGRRYRAGPQRRLGIIKVDQPDCRWHAERKHRPEEECRQRQDGHDAVIRGRQECREDGEEQDVDDPEQNLPRAVDKRRSTKTQDRGAHQPREPARRGAVSTPIVGAVVFTSDTIAYAALLVG